MPMRVGLPSHPHSFLIEKRGDLTVAQDGMGRIRFSGTDAASVIQSAHDALPSTGGVIFLKPDVDADGRTLTITKSNVALVSGLNQMADVWQTPRISKILLDATSADLKNILISGLNIRELDFYANGHVIFNTIVEKTQIRPSSTAGYKGIIFRGSSYTYFVKFNDVHIYDYYSQSTNNQGAITIIGTNDANGQIYFNRLFYHAGTDNAVMFCADGGRTGVPPIVFDQLNYVEINHANCKVFNIKPNSRIANLLVAHSTFEMHDSITLFTLQDGTSMNFLCEFSDNYISVGDSTGDVTTFITNNVAEANWITWRRNGIYGKNNVISATGSDATFALGTVGANTRFGFDVDAVYSYGTTLTYLKKNSGVATFSGNGSNKVFTIAHNLISAPTKVLVTAGSDAAKGDFYVTADATNITVTYGTAPPSGTNNVVLYWHAEV